MSARSPSEVKVRKIHSVLYCRNILIDGTRAESSDYGKSVAHG
jgi:hypothetical protein